MNGSQDESNMNSLQNKWLSRRIKHELSTKQMAVKTNQTWTLYKTNGGQDESNMNSLQNKCVWITICFVEISCFLRLDCHLFCRVHVWFVLTVISFVKSSCLIRLDCHLFCREFMFDSSWLLYKTNGSQDESNMNSLHNNWLSRRFKHELSTKQMAVKTNQTWTLYKTKCLIRLDCHLFCREFMFDSSWLPFVL
jgi:cytochrome bd-type quinol oxidase subunit 2